MKLLLAEFFLNFFLMLARLATSLICDYNTMWLWHLTELKDWRSLEIYFIIETAEFFSFHCIAHSRPPPSRRGCSQSVRPLVFINFTYPDSFLNENERIKNTGKQKYVLLFSQFIKRISSQCKQKKRICNLNIRLC